MTTPNPLRRSHRLALLGGAALVAVVLGACIPPRGTPPVLSTTTTTEPGSILVGPYETYSPIEFTPTATTGTFERTISVQVDNLTNAPINIATGRAVLTDAPAGMTVSDTTPPGTGCYVDTPDGQYCIHSYKLTWAGATAGDIYLMTLTIETNGFSAGFTTGIVAGVAP